MIMVEYIAMTFPIPGMFQSISRVGTSEIGTKSSCMDLVGDPLSGAFMAQALTLKSGGGTQSQRLHPDSSCYGPGVGGNGQGMNVGR